MVKERVSGLSIPCWLLQTFGFYLWILEVLRAQEIPCSFFLLGFGLPLGLDAALRC